MARAAVPSDHVVVRVLGATEFTVGTRRIGMGTEALFALGLYLTTRAGERVSRDDVLDTFWPGGEEEARRHAMRQMLYRLRQKGMGFLEDGDTLRLDPGKVDSDLRRCLAAGWPESATAQDVEGALAFGPTFSSRLPRAFLDWCDGIRSEVSHQARKAAMQLIASARSQGRWADLDRWAKAVLQTDPLHEEATLARAEAASMSGAKTLALEILDGYLAEVGTGDGSVGKPALQLRKRIAERRASWIPTGPREVPLVGREEEMSALTQAVESALLGRSRSVLLVGPSGYGKSRLLAEAREYAAIRGVRCVAVRAEATLASHPWAAVRELCKTLIAQPGAVAVDTRSMETMRALLREDVAPEGGISFGPVTTESDIRRALVAVIEAISHEARTLLTLDDLQNADSRSITTINAMLLDIQTGRCSCIAATHPGALPQNDRAGGRLGIQQVRLRGLTPLATRELAAATAGAHQSTPTDDALDHIAEKAGGHPLFARELALSHVRGGSLAALPTTLADVVARNLSTQPAESILLLRVIALLGNTATISRVQQSSAMERGAFIAAIDALSQEGVLHVDHARNLRLHDSWREAILAATPDVVLAALALECAEILQLENEELSSGALSRLADLLQLAGEQIRSIDFRLRSIDSLLAAGLHESALEAVRAQPVAASATLARARLAVRESVALLGTGRLAQCRETSDGVCVSTDAHIMLDMADRAPTAELLFVAGSGSLSSQDAARACLWGIRATSNAGDSRGMREFARLCAEAVGPSDSTPTSALVKLIYAAELGSAADISVAYDDLRRVDLKGLPISDQCLMLRCAAHALRIGGLVEESVATAEAAFTLAQANSLELAGRLAAELLFNTHLDQGSASEAARWLARLTDAKDDRAIASTSSAAAHMRHRLEFFTGRQGGVTSQILARRQEVDRIGRTQSKASELALLAAAYATRGQLEEARLALRDAVRAAESFVGRYAGDSVLEYCMMTARHLGGDSETESLAREHVLQRVTARGLKIPPGMPLLREIAG